MFSSLRNRLLLSYGLVICVLVLLFCAGSFIALFRNPLVYESATQKLRNTQQQVVLRLNSVTDVPGSDYSQAVTQIDQYYGVRALVYTPDSRLLADSKSDSEPSLQISPARLPIIVQKNEVAFARDETLRIWLVLAQPLDSQTILLLAVRRPRLGVVEFFSSELLRPITYTAIVGLVLAFIISLLLARWISNPIRQIDKATHSVVSGKYEPILPEGPSEIRELATSFNRMSQQVAQAQQSQRDLVANVSHELKTPLTSIQGFTQAILDGVIQTPEEIQQTVALIHTESGRMSRLVQDLVSLARLESDNGFHQEQVDLTALLRHILYQFNIQAESRGLSLVDQLEPLPVITGNADRLAQAFSNLMDNALKYTPAGGTITLAGNQEVGVVVIRVSDTGPGIPPEDRENVFERFFRSEETHSSEAQTSAGLGLAITRQIIRLHHGTIYVEPNSPHGSIFVVKLFTGG